MNLHSIASGVISAVNPMVMGTVTKSLGHTMDAAGKAVLSWAAPYETQMQKQAVSQEDLKHLDMLNMQGVFTKIWLNGALYGVNRAAGDTGGDIINLGTEKWLVVNVMEVWPDWCSVICALQRNP